MTNQKYTIVIPIITTLIMFASISGIIGNAFLLSNSTGGTRSFTIDNLDPQEIKMRPVNLPDNLENPEVRIVLDSDDVEIKQVNIYLSDETYYNPLNTIDNFENSSYFRNEVIDYSREVNDRQSFDLPRSYDTIYIFFGNEGDQTISLTVTIMITETLIGQTSTGRILGVVFSSLLTFFFLMISVYLWFEYFELAEQRLLNNDLEEKLDTIQDKALSWELFVAGIGIILGIFGYAQILMGSGVGNLIGAIIAGGIVYYNYTNRQKIESSIKSVLVSHGDISLSELSNLIGHSEEDTKKALLDAIMYSDLPATFDFKSKMITYHPEKEPQPQIQVEEEKISESNFQVSSQEVQSGSIPDDDTNTPDRPLPVCAYCETKAIALNAQFCHACGASMSSAK